VTSSAAEMPQSTVDGRGRAAECARCPPPKAVALVEPVRDDGADVRPSPKAWVRPSMRCRPNRNRRRQYVLPVRTAWATASAAAGMPGSNPGQPVALKTQRAKRRRRRSRQPRLTCEPTSPRSRPECSAIDELHVGGDKRHGSRKQSCHVGITDRTDIGCRPARGMVSGSHLRSV
jgi:hypothetical protein